jgi:WD40 repeat protein
MPIRWLLVLFVFCSPIALAQGKAAPVSYRKQIAPILSTSCNACHGGATPQSRLDTNTYAKLLAGGAHGKAVVPGDPRKSLILAYVEGRKQPKMPIGGSLTPAEIGLIRRWILEGAKSDGESAADPSKSLDTGGIPVRPDILPQAASLAWSKDGKLLAVGTYREVKLFEMPGGKLLRTLGGHADVVRALGFSPDGATLGAAGGVPGVGGEIRFWNLADGTLKKTLTGHTDCIYGFDWRPDGKQFATSSYDKTVKIWDVTKGVSIAELKDHADAVYGLAYSASGKYLATASADRSIRVWDGQTGKRLYSLAGHTEMVTSLAAHPTADQIASVSADKTMRVWNLGPDGGSAIRTSPAQADVLTDVRYSPDGKWIVTASNDGTVKVWDASNGNEVRKLTNPDAILAVTVDPANQLVAIGGYDGSVTLCKLADGAKSAALISFPHMAAKTPAARNK